MLVGCSEIRISVIVKYMQYIGIIRAFYLPEGFVQFFSVWKHIKNCWILVS